MGLNRTVAAIFGVVYIVAGVAGFILTSPLFGLFPMSTAAQRRARRAWRDPDLGDDEHRLGGAGEPMGRRRAAGAWRRWASSWPIGSTWCRSAAMTSGCTSAQASSSFGVSLMGASETADRLT